MFICDELAESLSQRFDTQVFIHDWEDIASSQTFSLYDRGGLIEAFSMFRGNPVYQGATGQADLRRKRAEGWQISSDHTFEFLTKRGTILDIESSKECSSLLERVTAGLEMFIAAQPFWFNPKLGRIELEPGWERDHFAAAKILYQSKTRP